MELSLFFPISFFSIQIRVNSTKVIRVIQVESEEKLKELDGFSLWMYIGLFFKEKLNDTYINVDIFSKETCLKVEILDPDSKYTISVTRSKFSFILLALTQVFHHLQLQVGPESLSLSEANVK